jgi:hypothetical protein
MLSHHPLSLLQMPVNVHHAVEQKLVTGVKGMRNATGAVEQENVQTARVPRK